MRHLLTYRYIDEVARSGSIRGAAEKLAITPSALNRRILTLEDELGVPVFERLHRGVRLNTAGELLIQHIRAQLSDLERVQSQIADLSGVRRGNVLVACSQALLPYFLPEQIAIYRRSHPAVKFGVFVRERDEAEQALTDYSADVAIVFEPIKLADFHTLLTVPQSIHAIMAEGHPLAHQRQVRLSQCFQYPCALPALPCGVRGLIDVAAKRQNLKVKSEIESDSIAFLGVVDALENIISFQIKIGLPRETRFSGQVHLPLDPRDISVGRLHLGQLRGRTLPVAAARFFDQLTRTFNDEYACD